MTEDIDIWRAANLLVKQHGEDAAIMAARRADESLARGNVDGQAVWMRILRAVAELTRLARGDGEQVN